MIWFEDPDTRLQAHEKEQIIDLATESIALLSLPFACDINIIMVGKEEIKAINQESRQKNQVTDVLSFPNLPIEEAENYGTVQVDSPLVKDPETGRVILGDIVLCVDQAREQAREYNHSEKREFAFLIIHSLLHLLGHDHIEEEDDKLMRQRQNDILNQLKITR